MTNKIIPTNIHVIHNCIPEKTGFDFYGWKEQGAETTEYTLVYNNPDYHVIPKSDVDGDVMRALDRISDACWYPSHMSTDYSFEGDIDKLRNALIAQSERVKKLEERLQIDEWGLDRIDQLEENLDEDRWLRDKLNVAVDALKFYADSKNYEISVGILGLASCPVDLDDGSKAVDALKQIQG